MKKNESTRDKIDDNIDNHSALLLTQYSSKASQLIKSFTKNILFLILILFVITGMTILDLSMDLGFINVLSDETIDAIIIGTSLFLIVFTILIVRPVYRSQNILEKWSNLFDKNAIRTGIILSINNKNKEEILSALSETIEQIATPLQNYLSKSDNKEFFDISINDTTFDILIDKSTIKSVDENSLKNTIQDYGSIIIKITDGVIDKAVTHGFIQSLQKYSRQQGNKIGLAMIIGESITPESYDLVSKTKDKIINENLILIEKPTTTDPDLMNLNNVLH
ncbi:MAG: hypothetical protein QOK90_11665 [Nitrososphaeraceae archaeon]|jgi:hypothetical protein|nr:hypothetical protein [Nitrososphaeraceae archaeon]MDW3612777.1 hypothetical protein [Nitrososphaeraceae archaeon]MDW3626445.1 hypothetical protein [Nitrososphaeraceae archaeon]